MGATGIEPFAAWAADLSPLRERIEAMHVQTPRRHHFVPKFLLRPWLIGGPAKDFKLWGYYWDSTQNKVRCKQQGLNSFCFQLDLLTLRSYGVELDAIETEFFGEIDTNGAKARDALMKNDPDALTSDQRCDFARLLLSLEGRRPTNIERLRTEGRAYLAKELDKDSEIRRAMNEEGISDNASEYVENKLGQRLDDVAVTNIQKLVDNPTVGGRLINADWSIKRVEDSDGSLVLSDRPLIREHGYDRPGAAWVLPLTPRSAFIACNHRSNTERLLNLSGQRFVKAVNTSSAAQAERYVFCADASHESWLGKYLRASS